MESAMDDGTRAHDPIAHVASLLERFARERNLTLPPLAADGTGSIQRGSAVVSIHVLADRSVLLLLAKVATAPALDATQATRLLTLSFVETRDAAFALHPQTGDLYLRILRGLEGLDYEEFEDLVHSIAQTADHWDDRLAKELAHPEGTGSPGGSLAHPEGTGSPGGSLAYPEGTGSPGGSLA